MLVYHRTKNGAEILRAGFRDGGGMYMFLIDEPLIGVWLSDVPLDCNEGAKGRDLLEVDIPEDVLLEYEVVEYLNDDEKRELGIPPDQIREDVKVPWKQYREFHMPAEVVNRYPVRQIDD